jgi:hypothetical protein
LERKEKLINDHEINLEKERRQKESGKEAPGEGIEWSIN